MSVERALERERMERLRDDRAVAQPPEHRFGARERLYPIADMVQDASNA